MRHGGRRTIDPARAALVVMDEPHIALASSKRRLEAVVVHRVHEDNIGIEFIGDRSDL
jgi:ABC-type sugar transport system ATPase subunit